ncbi:Uncharacterised protein [Klebsiella pneumoniae]|nr:Uncharacterised protein [Klebsiella pneumoniae]STR82866.1 Uncharacterised protein [Klebsiella pneumoniae]STS03869.1 Uncharacterised protein [Klebsiella pneumoniae]STS30144.1 Uncharacterised protein [Klebsiella pneumoniae]STS51433.1 Uncharacterised protein [Klebsiella pneumoniae]
MLINILNLFFRPLNELKKCVPLKSKIPVTSACPFLSFALATMASIDLNETLSQIWLR